MNIFVLDTQPELAARAYCDMHVPKMCLESTQMLTCAYHTSEHDFEGFPLTDESGAPRPYRMTHGRHPCTAWASANATNFDWLLRLNRGLANEFRRRFSGRAHASEPILEWMWRNRPSLASGRLTEFAQAMPEQFRGADPVEAYRLFYASKSARMPLLWRNGAPGWYTPELAERAVALLPSDPVVQL